MAFNKKASTKLIAPSIFKESLEEQQIFSIASGLLPQSTAREGGDCLLEY